MKTNLLLKFTIALSCLVLAASSTRAIGVTATWTNGAATNAWENAGNWDTNPLFPNSALFNVVISIAAPCNLSSGYQIDSLTLSVNTANLNLIPGATLAFTSDVTNNGAILVNTTAAASQTKIRFDADGALDGNGIVKLNGGGNFNYADLDIQNFTVTHGANHTIHGNGTIIGFNGGSLINNGTIIGDDSGGTFMQLDLANTTNQNNATIKATNGGGLGLFGGTIDQTGGGTFLADGANSVVLLGGGSFVTVIGGILNTANAGLIEPNGGGVVLNGVTNNGTVQIPAGNIIVATGTGLTNNSTILVNTTAAASQTQLRFDADGVLGGNGSVTLNGAGQFNYADLNIQNFTVTHGANHTIHGNGTIIGFSGGTLINNGTIIGDDSTGLNMQLDLANTANKNNATIKATNGGALGFFSGTIDQTGGGTFLADGTNSVVQFGGGSFATLIGGTTNTANSGILLGVYTGWQGVTNKGTVQIPAGDIIVVTGTGLTNNSTILVNTTAAASQTKIRFDADGALDGNGIVKLNGGGNFNYADLDIQNFTVTHGANHTIHGNGTIIGFNGGSLINNGTIIGDDSGGTFMQLDLANTTNQNNATIKATNGGGLGLFGGTIDQTGGGTFLADGANSVVLLGGSNPVTVMGGILNTANGGLIEANGAGVFLSGVTNNGTVQIPAGDIIVATGTGLTNNGTILVNTTGTGSQTRLRFDADGTLGGIGSVTLNGAGGFNFAGVDCNGHSVINGANHTIKGNGNIFMSGGTLTNNGIITPGLSPGHLDYSGTLTLGSTSNLVFEIGGTTQVTQYDLLSKSDGAAQTLGGNLVVRLINNFTPASTDMFAILTTQTTLAGAFSNVASGQRLSTADGHGSFIVTYSGNNVVLSQFVAVSPSSKIVSIFTRENLTKSGNVLTSTFSISGTDPKKIIVRGLGLSLQREGGLSDPTLVVQKSNGVTIATNDNWKDTQQVEIQASGHAPGNDKESAIVATLSPGSYVATLRNRTSRGVGIGQVDVYDLNIPANSQLNTMSSRGFTGSGNLLTGGFTIGGGSGNLKLLLRAMGPSQEATLQDPTLTLANGNGSTIFFNDNWQDTQKTQIQATGLAPGNTKESAILITLAPGDYTETVMGKKTSSGTALVEFYNLPQLPQN